MIIFRLKKPKVVLSIQHVVFTTTYLLFNSSKALPSKATL